MKTLFTVLPVAGDIGEAWAAGRIGDRDLIRLATAGSLPCPVALVVLRADGGPAGMRALMAFLAFLGTLQSVTIAGYAMRTRLRGVERIFERFNGRVAFDEGGDGDRRWWAPAEPFGTWLREFNGRG